MKILINILCILTAITSNSQEIIKRFSSLNNESFRINKLIELENNELYLYGGNYVFTNGSIPFDSNAPISSRLIKVNNALNTIEEYNMPMYLEDIGLINQYLLGTSIVDTVINSCQMGINTNKISIKTHFVTYDLLNNVIFSDSLILLHNQCGSEGVVEHFINNNEYCCYMLAENIVSPTSTINEFYFKRFDYNWNEIESYQNNSFTDYGLSIKLLENDKELINFQNSTITFHDSTLVFLNQIVKNDIDSFEMSLRLSDSNNDYIVVAGNKRLYSSVDSNHHNPIFVSEIVLLDKIGNVVSDEIFYDIQIEDIAISNENEIIVLHDKRTYFNDEFDKPYTMLKLDLTLNNVSQKDYGINTFYGKLKKLANNKFALYGTLETESTNNPIKNDGYVIIDDISSISKEWTNIVDNPKLDFNLYPNPFKDKLSIEYNSSENLIFTIYNYQGQQIIFDKITEKIIDLSILEKGYYFISIYNAENKVLFFEKLIKN